MRWFWILLLVPSELQATELDGAWRQACLGFYQREEHFSGDSVTYVETNYSDRACERPTIEMRSHGKIVLGAPLAIPSGASAIDFQFTRIDAVLYSEDYVRYFREKKVCGTEEWELQVPREVTGLDCDVFRAPKAGDMRFGIYRVEGNELFFGKLTPERNALTPGQRPLEWDPVPYLRQDFENR